MDVLLYKHSTLRFGEHYFHQSLPSLENPILHLNVTRVENKDGLESEVTNPLTNTNTLSCSPAELSTVTHSSVVEKPLPLVSSGSFWIRSSRSSIVWTPSWLWETLFRMVKGSPRDSLNMGWRVQIVRWSDSTLFKEWWKSLSHPNLLQLHFMNLYFNQHEAVNCNKQWWLVNITIAGVNKTMHLTNPSISSGFLLEACWTWGYNTVNLLGCPWIASILIQDERGQISETQSQSSMIASEVCLLLPTLSESSLLCCWCVTVSASRPRLRGRPT